MRAVQGEVGQPERSAESAEIQPMFSDHIFPEMTPLCAMSRPYASVAQVPWSCDERDIQPMVSLQAQPRTLEEVGVVAEQGRVAETSLESGLSPTALVAFTV